MIKKINKYLQISKTIPTFAHDIITKIKINVMKKIINGYTEI